MKTKIPFLIVLSILMFAAAAEAKIVEKDVEHDDGERTCLGYAAWDDAFEGSRPGCL